MRATSVSLLGVIALGIAFGTAQMSTATEPSQLAVAEVPRDVPEPVLFDPLEPLAVHPPTSLTIVQQLKDNHYVPKPLDDSASSEIFEKYLAMLDPGRAYFLASDIEKIEANRYKLDDALKRGDLTPAFEMFNQLQVRVVDRLEYLLGVLEKGLDQMDFTLPEQLEIDRENAPWPRTDAELNALWDRRLKASVLNMKLNGKPLDEIQTVLTKRYSNRLKQTKQTKSEDAFQLYVNAFASTYDPHTQYFSPRSSENFNINMSLSLEGIGAVLRNEDEYTSVVRLVTAGPADKSGLLDPSDRIIGVGQGESGAMIDVVGWRLDDVVELIRGPKGSIVRLEVIPANVDDGTTKTIQITRNTVQLEEQSAQKKLLTFHRNGQQQRIGVVQVPTFYVDFKAIQRGDPNYKSTTRDVRRLIEELKAEGIDGLVIDLRNNGGGSLQEADQLTGLFIKSGPTVQVKNANKNAHVYSDKDNKVTWEGPMAVLVNRLSASASEIFAGAIQDYGRGLVVGSQTFGKGTVQTLVPLNRGQLKITQAKYYRVSGQSTQHQGVLPDIGFPEIYDTGRIGESSLDDALPWDMIKPTIYPRFDDIQPILNVLKDRHAQRVADDADFVYLRALAAKGEENRAKTHISLNEATRIAEKKADDQWRLALENALRKSKGEPELATLDELDAAADDDEDDEDPNKDALLRETGDILLDYIGLTQQIAMLEPIPTTADAATATATTANAEAVP